jgi:uncharacterized protein
MVCSDDELAQLDNLMDNAYQAALHNFPEQDREAVKKEQISWIASRNECEKKETMRACIMQLYKTRITDLQIRGGRLVVPEPVYYKCGDAGDQSLTAIFYTQTPLPAVVLTGYVGNDMWQDTSYGDQSDTAPATYRGRTVVFQNTATGATLTRNGKKSDCTRLPPTRHGEDG